MSIHIVFLHSSSTFDPNLWYTALHSRPPTRLVRKILLPLHKFGPSSLSLLKTFDPSSSSINNRNNFVKNTYENNYRPISYTTLMYVVLQFLVSSCKINRQFDWTRFYENNSKSLESDCLLISCRRLLIRPGLLTFYSFSPISSSIRLSLLIKKILLLLILLTYVYSTLIVLPGLVLNHNLILTFPYFIYNILSLTCVCCCLIPLPTASFSFSSSIHPRFNRNKNIYTLNILLLFVFVCSFCDFQNLISLMNASISGLFRQIFRWLVASSPFPPDRWQSISFGFDRISRNTKSNSVDNDNEAATKRIISRGRSFFLPLAYDIELHGIRGDPIWVRTLSSHCSGPFKCNSIQQGVEVTVWRLKDGQNIVNQFILNFYWEYLNEALFD